MPAQVMPYMPLAGPAPICQWGLPAEFFQLSYVAPLGDRAPLENIEKYLAADVETPPKWDCGAGIRAIKKDGGNCYAAAFTGYGWYGDGSGDMVGLHGRMELYKTNPEATPFGGWSFAYVAPGVTAYKAVCGHETNVSLGYTGTDVPDHYAIGYNLDSVIHNFVSENPGIAQNIPMSCGTFTGVNRTYDANGNWLTYGARMRTGWFVEPDAIAPESGSALGKLNEVAYLCVSTLPENASGGVRFAKNLTTALDFQNARFTGAPFNFCSEDDSQVHRTADGRIFVRVVFDQIVGKYWGIEAVPIPA